MKLQIATINHVTNERVTPDQRTCQVLLFRDARTTRWGSRNDETTKLQIATIDHVNDDVFFMGLPGRQNNTFWVVKQQIRVM
jgi:hypothetical protein